MRLLPLGLLLALVASAGAARADVTTLNFATTNAPTTRLNIQYLHPWAEAINADLLAFIKTQAKDP